MKLLSVTRTITWTTKVPMSSYPGMTPEEAIAHEENLPIEEISDLLDFDQAELTTNIRLVDE